MPGGRKPLPKAGEYPHIGRYRLYDRAGINRLRCRLCGRVVKRENQWRHADTEADRYANVILAEGVYLGWGIEMDIALKLRARRSRKNRRHAQYQYATGGEPWRKRGTG